MKLRTRARKDDERPGARADEEAHGRDADLKPGAMLGILEVPHRIVALVGDRVFASCIHTHHPYLVQDDDGSIQLPTRAAVLAMMNAGRAALVPSSPRKPSANARMRVQIAMLDAADVRQGDKAIWIHLAANWTPALRAEFGPHDEPWKIRRWRAALRRAVRTGDDAQGGARARHMRSSNPEEE